MEETLRAIPAAPGIAIGKTLWFKNEKIQIQPKQSDSAVEIERLNQACVTVSRNIHQMLDSLKDRQDEAAIFNAHLTLLKDPDLMELAHSKLDQGAEYAWDSAIQFFAEQLNSLPDEYLRARSVDIRDVGQQVLRALLGIDSQDLSNLKSPVILLAQDLPPSATSRMNKSMILGFATEEGSSTSHTAILAKALGIPAVVGTGPALKRITDNVNIVLNGNTGEVFLNPNDAIRKEYLAKQRQEQANQTLSLSKAQLPAVTQDGHQVEVVANVGNLDNASAALTNGAEGIGLLRTELLYMDQKTAPEEEAQYKIYQAIFNVMASRPIVIRTLDIGGDKSPAYMDLGQESNPFLGWRAIRVCLDRPDFFKKQLRAILRASIGHDVRIMFPMISQLDELRRAKALLDEARTESGIQEPVQVGIMVEIPSVVQMIDLFVPEADFFSIGTNDLSQYTFAVDRTNPKVASLADACHPAVLRQIQHVIQVAHEGKKWVGVCGELAGNPTAVPILLGLGLDEFSMSATSIPAAKEIVRNWDMPAAKKLAAQALNLSSASEVRELVHDFSKKR